MTRVGKNIVISQIGAEISMRTIGTALIVFLGFAIPVSGQQMQIEGKTAEKVFKNIQGRKGAPASELGYRMHCVTGALGVDCEYCHVGMEFDKDDKKTKHVAREMITMMTQINKSYFDGRQEVTCSTCHQGAPIPYNVPVLPVPAPAEEKKVTTLPTVDQLLDKYIESLGGEKALRAIKTRLVIGTQDIPTGPGGITPVPARLERYQKAPSLTLDTYTTETFTSSDGFDGATSWSKDMRGRVMDGMEIDQRRARRSSDFYESLDLRQEYTKLEVVGFERVNNADDYVIVGYPENDLPERLYFSVQSGLLVRKTSDLPTPLGMSPYEEDYDDY